MARSMISALLQANRAMQREAARQQRAASREHAASIREAEKAQRADERARAQARRANAADRKRLEKAAKAAHVAAREAEVEERNLELAAKYDDIDTLLAATLAVDDYVDLESLRRTDEHPPFDRSDLEIPTPAPVDIPEPDEPKLTLPEPKGFFRKRKKHALAVAAAEAAHAEAHAAWELEIEEVRQRRKENSDRFDLAERTRIASLERERARFAAEILQHNQRLDTLIANLGYGTAEAVQEYISIVASNSAYPDHFQVESSFAFEPTTAELKMRVSVPPPGSIPSVKAYKYKKASDEVTATALSQKATRDRYSRAVHQVALRSFHEVFEADRRGLIRTISLEVGTTEASPETGIVSYIPFVAVAAERDVFNSLDLSSVVPGATLNHLGGAVSKNPYGLVAADTTGVRRS